MLIYKDGKIHEESKIRMPMQDEKVLVTLVNEKNENIKKIIGDIFDCHPLVVEDCIYYKRNGQKWIFIVTMLFFPFSFI